MFNIFNRNSIKNFFNIFIKTLLWVLKNKNYEKGIATKLFKVPIMWIVFLNRWKSPKTHEWPLFCHSVKDQLSRDESKSEKIRQNEAFGSQSNLKVIIRIGNPRKSRPRRKNIISRYCCLNLPTITMVKSVVTFAMSKWR